MRVAIYARVSTDDRGQDPENQLTELRGWAANAGHTVSREYVDYESGRKGAERRKQFGALFDEAAKRKFDCVLFWALDRFSPRAWRRQSSISSGCRRMAVSLVHRGASGDRQRASAQYPARPAIVAGESRGAENRRANQGRDGPSEGKGHQDRTAKAWRRIAPANRPARCEGRDILRDREGARHRPPYGS
jgi:hypothetical protein